MADFDVTRGRDKWRAFLKQHSAVERAPSARLIGPRLEAVIQAQAGLKKAQAVTLSAVDKEYPVVKQCLQTIEQIPGQLEAVKNRQLAEAQSVKGPMTPSQARATSPALIIAHHRQRKQDFDELAEALHDSLWGRTNLLRRVHNVIKRLL
jgi:hypothetical protein